MPPPPSPNNSALPRSERLARGARLTVCLAAIAVLWLYVLPQAARTPAIRTMIDRNEALGVNPSAKFYSELPAMPEIRDRMQARRREAPEAFWRPANRAK